MSRFSPLCQRRAGLLALATTALLFAGTQTAHATLSFLIANPITGATSFSVSAGQTSFNLELYAAIQDTGGAGAAGDGIKQFTGGIALAGADTGSISFSGTGPTATTFSYFDSPSASGAALPWSSGGSVGIGGSVNGVNNGTTQTVFWGQTAYITGTVTPNAGNWISAVGTSYTLVPMGSFTMTFGGTLPNGGTDTMTINKTNGSVTNSQLWEEAGVAKSGQGSSSTVVLGLVAPVTFSFGSSTGGSTVDSVLGITSPLATSSQILSTASSPVAGSVSVTGTAVSPNTSDSISSVTATPSSQYGGSFTPSSSGLGTLSPGTTTSVAFSYKASPTFFGIDKISLSAAGNNTTSGDPASAGPLSTTINVAGVGAIGNPDGTSFGPLLTSSTGGIAGLTIVSSGDLVLGVSTTATILAGSGSGAVTARWRARLSNEIAPTPPNNLPIVSDVLDLEGIPSGTPYALQMTFATDGSGSLPNLGKVQSLASKGLLYLGDRNSTSGAWVNAVGLNTSTGSAAVGNYDNSYAAFTSSGQPGFGQSLQNLIGSWGVDTTNDDVWAVVNYDATFGVVPEPGTLALLATGVAALGFAYRRRKVAKA